MDTAIPMPDVLPTETVSKSYLIIVDQPAEADDENIMSAIEDAMMGSDDVTDFQIVSMGLYTVSEELT